MQSEARGRLDERAAARSWIRARARRQDLVARAEWPSNRDVSQAPVAKFRDGMEGQKRV